MKPLFKWIGRLLLLALVGVGIYVGANWYHVKHFPSIISSFYARMACSCLFVHKRDEATCKNYARQYVPVQRITISTKEKSVTVKGLWRTNKATFVSPRYGCTLEPYKP